MDSTTHIELYKNLLRTIADPFFIIGEDGTYLEALGGTERSLYDDASSLKGRNIYDFMIPDFAQFFMQKVHETIKGGTLNCFEYLLATETVQGIQKNGPGGNQWFEARMFPLEGIIEGQKAVTALVINITERKLLQQRLRELSYQDVLTQVSNRRYFFEKLDEKFNGFIEDHTPLSIIILDIDRFKLVNDTYGHLAGDSILQQCVPLMKKILRKGDTIARFGGDEFIISLDNTTVLEAYAIGERIRKLIEGQVFICDSETIHITISMGVTDATLFDADIASLVSRADRALYHAKEQGRNQIVKL